MKSNSALDHGLASTAAVLALAFSDYFVTLPFSAGTLAAMVRQDSVDLAASRVWFVDGAPAGVLLHAQRGWSARLAAMGVTPAARRRGLGAKMVESWIAECRQRGLRRLVLEVIGANTAARQLYERAGFANVQRLAGWNFAPGSTSPALEVSAREPSPLDLRDLGRMIGLRDRDGALPWQIAAESVAQLGPPWTAWQLGGAAVAVSDLAVPTIAVRGLVWADADGPQSAAELLRRLTARHPAHTWRAPAIFPEAWSPAFVGAGWQPAEIDQWQMAQTLAPS